MTGRAENASAQISDSICVTSIYVTSICVTSIYVTGIRHRFPYAESSRIGQGNGMDLYSIDRLERGIHGYFPFGQPRRTSARQPVENLDWDALELLEDMIDQALPNLSVRPGTRCTEAEHRHFYGRVRQACKDGQAFGCRGTDSVNELYAKAAIAQDCANARFAYQRRCFSRSHPDWRGHETQRAQARRAARTCWEMARSRAR